MMPVSLRDVVEVVTRPAASTALWQEVPADRPRRKAGCVYVLYGESMRVSAMVSSAFCSPKHTGSSHRSEAACRWKGAFQHDGGDRHLILRETRLALYHRGDRGKDHAVSCALPPPLSDIRRQHVIGMTIRDPGSAARRVLLGDAVRIREEKSFCLIGTATGPYWYFKGP